MSAPSVRPVVSRRVRFEVFKRDGFRCRYCGATATAAPLEVDHVIPAASGGRDDPANLVTACWSCNRGKSDVPLTATTLPPAIPAALLREQVDQVRAYLEAQRDVEAVRAEVRAAAVAEWRRWCTEDPPRDFLQKLDAVLGRDGLAALGDALRIAALRQPGAGALRRWKYAQGAMKLSRRATESVATPGLEGPPQ